MYSDPSHWTKHRPVTTIGECQFLKTGFLWSSVCYGRFRLAQWQKFEGQKLNIYLYIFFFIYVGSTTHPVTVTTRIITFLVGNPYKPSFVTVTGRGVDQIHVYIYIYIYMGARCTFLAPPNPNGMVPPIPRSTSSNSSSTSTSTT